MGFKVIDPAGRGNIYDHRTCEIRVVSAGDMALLLAQGWQTPGDFKSGGESQQVAQTSTTQAPEKRKRRTPNEIAEVHEKAEAAGVLTDGRRIDAIERELEALEVG